MLALLILVAAIGIPIIKGNLKQTEEVVDTAPSPQSEKLVKMLGLIETVSIDFGIVNGKEFNYLYDFRKSLPSIPIGRSNPFANY